MRGRQDSARQRSGRNPVLSLWVLIAAAAIIVCMILGGVSGSGAADAAAVVHFLGTLPAKPAAKVMTRAFFWVIAKAIIMTAKKPKKNLARGFSTGAPVAIGNMPT